MSNLLLQVWNWIMEPMLFATIGTSIVFSTLPSETIPKSLLVVCTGGCLGLQLGCCVPQAVAGHQRFCLPGSVCMLQIACSRKFQTACSRKGLGCLV